jgi:hypothetical protein
MKSTSPKFNTLEFREYLEAFKAWGVNAIVFNKLWWIFAFGFSSFRLLKLEDIDPNALRLGGFLADYQHNLPAALERAGFGIVLARMTPESCFSGGYFHHFQIAAVNKNNRSEIKFDPSRAPNFFTIGPMTSGG